MKCYRILHKPTGLYYCPSREILSQDNDHGRKYVKSNLSTKGKIYAKKPTINQIISGMYRQSTIYSHIGRDRTITVDIDDFEIQEI